MPPRRAPTLFSPTSAFSTPSLHPPPLPPHPSDSAPVRRGLSTPATAFALKSYFETLLLGLGWEPSTTSPQSFIRQYSWLLAEELDTTPENAVKIFEEIFDKCTPSLAAVCHAIIGMEEKLSCTHETSNAVRNLFRRNHDCSPEMLLSVAGEDKLEEKVGVGTLRGVRRRFGRRELWRRIFAGLIRRAFGKGKGNGKKAG